MSWRKAVAALLSAALVAFAPGLECWRVFAQEIVRPNIPVSPAGGAIGAAGASLPVAAPSVSLAPSVLTAPLGLPRSAIVVAPSRRTAAAPGTVVVRVAPAAGASPGAAAQSVAGAGGGSLLRSLLWRDAGAARPSEPTALGRSVERLSQPALSVPQGNSGENASAEADRDFAQRRGAPSGTGASEDVAPAATARPLGTTVAAAPVVDLQRPTVEARHSGPLAVEGPSAAAPLAIEPVRPLAGRSPAVPALEGAFGVAGQDVRYRSVVAPAAATAFAAAAWAVALAVPAALAWAGGALGVQSAMQAAQGTAVLSAAQALWTVVTYGTFGVAAGLALYAAVDVAFLATAVWAGRRVSEDEFHGAVRRALRELGLGPAAVAGLAGHAPGRGTIHAYRGGSIATRLSFGFTTPHGVYLRPELARFPWLLKRVLRHELYHFHQNRGRGPPAQKPEGMLASIAHEFGARLQEDFGGKWLRELKIGVLERVVREAQVSLSLPYDYDVVVVRPEKDTLRDPEEFKALSGGRAKVTEAGDLAELHARPNAARIIVAPGATQWLPQGEAEDAKKGRHLLERALRQLDDQYVLSKGLRSTASGNKKGAWRELEDLARKSRRSGDSDAERLQRLMSVLWRQVASGPLKDLAVLQSIGRLYGSLQDRGVLLLPFSADEPGVDLLFRLLNYWEGPDGGRLQVERISLPEGGHVLVARKVESRVNLWLKPRGGHAIAASTTNISRDPAKAPLAERILREAGFGDKELAEFKAAGVEVRHALGADIGDNRVFISVPKRKAKALKRYAERAGASIDASRGGYRVHLLDSGPMQNLPQTWKLRVEGEGGRIFDIDTGIDVTHPDFAGVINAMAEAGTPSPRVSSYDVTGEGDNDYIGHGTHKASISYANGTFYKGMAPKAEGRMGKVFTRDGFGASDGDIMAAAAEAMKWGADVISLSLGSPGDVGDPLSEFFSKLAEQKNAKGERPIITASMGNSGPSNRTGSQPAAGENVIAVAAAAKSKGDKDPEIAFFSSVGFARDTRFHLPRWILKPSITALGGDVTTRPESKDVYEHGIEAAKSKDMEASPSDTPDRLHTRMSGTSMSNPMIAGIALLVKQIALRFAATGSEARTFFLENLPYAVRLIMERASRDMRVPVAFQGAGLVDARAAAELAVSSVGGRLSLSELGWRRVLGAPREALRALRAAAASEETPWDWIARAKAVQDVEKTVYLAAEKAYQDAAAKAEAEAKKAEHPEAPREEAPPASNAAQIGHTAAQKTFNAARDIAVPTLVSALKDSVWLVRFYAALALYNMRAPAAALELAQLATTDPDGRVRQAAFLALANTPSFAADRLLAEAAKETRADRVDVAIYAAYALAKHGDGSAVHRIVQETTNTDKNIRFTAAWLIGEVGAKAGRAGSDALAGRVRDLKEQGNIRHLASAALIEVANADPAAVTDEAIVALLDSSGVQDLALTRTISKFFSSAARRRPLVERMRAEPLKPRITEFILANKAWVGRPGALGEMVSLLARIVGMPLDIPSPTPDPEGVGVPGVDPNLGPVHLIVEVPAGVRIERFQDLRGLAAPQAAEASAGLGLDPLALSRHEAQVQVAMPLSKSFWINVPESKVAAFTADFEAKGYSVRRSRPKYRMLSDTGPASGAPELGQRLGLTGKGVLVVYLDEGGDLSHPGIEKERVAHVRNFSGEGAVEDVTQESVGHGTHGMGIVGARAVEGSPYVGLASDASFAVGKVLGANGGSDAMVMAGMEWAMSLVDPLKTPVIVNLSLGGPGEADSPLSKLVNTLQLKDVAVVAAAGNEGPQDGTVGSPGNAPLAFRVGAVDKKGKLTFYSSRDVPDAKPLFFWLHYGGAVDFNVPNPYEIISTLATSLAEKLKDAATTVLWKEKPLYQTMSGTSMAAPHVTGQLAQLAQRMAEEFTKAGQQLPHGYWLWLGKLINSTLQKVEGLRPNEGAGMFDARAAANALEEALKNLDRVRRDSVALAREAEDKYGLRPATRGGFWVRAARAVGSALRGWLVPSLTGFTLPTKRLAEPIENAVRGRHGPRGPPAVAGALRRDGSWWKNPAGRVTAESVPLYALRRAEDDPGVGKFSDLSRTYRETLAPQGVDAVLLLPHFATLDESPYSPVSLYAVNEDHVDWSLVPEVAADAGLRESLKAKTVQYVDYPALRARERAVAAEAYRRFRDAELTAGGARAAEYRAFVARSDAWLPEYAEYMAIAELLGKPSLDWTAEDVSRARRDPRFAEAVQSRMFAQWQGARQLRAALGEIHAAGGRVLFDVPMFRGKNSVDAWKRPEQFTDLRTRNPGIVNQWVHEDWKDLALWNWTRLKADGYHAALEPYRHWLDFGFDGARADALHFAYRFGNGQLESGDEPGDDFVAALGERLREYEALPLAEAFEGKDHAARRLGFVTVGGDWKSFSTHDDPRRTDFLPRLLQLRNEGPSGPNAAFTAYTLGDEWADPFPVKEMHHGRSRWRYRMPMPSDVDYRKRARRDVGAQLRALKAAKAGDVLADGDAVREVFEKAADTFVKHENGGVQIWAASMDWFLEEWGRDTFVSLPGLLIATGRLAEAKENIRGFAKHEKDGLLPNRIHAHAEYNSADAPMWFIQAVKQVLEAEPDEAFAAEVRPVIRRILDRYAAGTGYDRYGRFNRIYRDEDGLVVTPAQSTWMDADPGGRDKPVTPRHGKAVEINALWYANLRFAAELERRGGDAAAAERFDAWADRAKRSFNGRFWFTTEDNAKAWGGEGGALRDVVDGDPHAEAIRPNMLFAVSHGGDLLSPERQAAVVTAATKDLLTPYGLRTLSYRDSHYRPVYETWKEPVEKDQAYHQGTAWPWLIGAYVDALVRVRRAQERPASEIRAEVQGVLRPLASFLVSRAEGSLPEVFDGGSPGGPRQNPGGTRSQAWSVAETLRALVEHGLGP